MRFRAILLFCLTVGCGPTHAFSIDFQKLGDALQKTVEAFKDFSEEQEVELGQGMSASLLGAAPLVDDEGVQAYVNRVGRWLAIHTERPDLPWTFAVIDTDSYNAFAAPGGYVFVTRGLFSIMRTEAELAGVLAHEMGHVLARHHLKALQSDARREFAAEMLTELAASKNASLRQNKKLFSALVSSGMSVYANGLDREDEYESDRIGVVLAARAGYEPFGLPGLLLALDAVKDDGGNKLTLLNATHPTFSDRIDRLDGAMTGSFDALAEQQILAERFLETRARIIGPE